MLNKAPVLIVASVLVFGCTGNDEPAPVPPAIANAQENVVYFDSDVFDLQLSQSIRSAHPVITVRPASAITINHIPARLNTWFVAVQRHGGSVNLIAVRQGPNGKQEEFVQLLLPIAIEVVATFVKQRMARSGAVSGYRDQVADYIKKDSLFLGAQNLLVTIRYDDESKEIEEIKFQKL